MDKDPGGIAFKDPTLPLCVVVTATRWDEPPRMRHHITRQLMRWSNVLFVELRVQGERGLRRVEDRLHLLTLPAHPRVSGRAYANIPFVSHLENLQHAESITRAAEIANAPCVILFNFVYHFPEIMKSPLFDFKVYICFDEFPKMWRRRTRGNWLRHFYQSRLLQARENRVASAADLCLTPHFGLKRKLETCARDVRMLFHAHEFEGFANPADANRADAKRANVTDEKGESIKVAFMGYIHYRLLDQWLLKILHQADMQLHLIGPVNSGYDISAFSGHTNLHVHAPVSGERLEALLATMDVLVMPYDPAIPEVEVLTTTSKLFQYIAAGKPIISSSLPNLIPLPQCVLAKAEDPDDFIAKIQQAYAYDCDEHRILRREFAEANTWDARGDELLGYLKESLGNRISEL